MAAERIRRVEVINAKGELQAAEKLLQASEIPSGKSEALQLRYIGALQDLAGQGTTTVVLPLPVDLMQGAANGGHTTG